MDPNNGVWLLQSSSAGSASSCLDGAGVLRYHGTIKNAVVAVLAL